MRGFIAATGLLVWLALRREIGDASGDRPPTSIRRALPHMLVLGTTNGWLASFLMVTAVRHADTAIVAMMQASVPLMVVVLAHFLFAEERFRIDQAIGVLTGFFGIALIIGPLAVLGSRGSLIGVAAMLLTAFCFACGTVYGRLIAFPDPALLACGQQVCGALIGGVISALTESARLWPQPARVWLLFAIVGVVCSALPTMLYLRLLTRAPSVPAALVAYLQPVWAMLLGWGVLGERIGGTALLGVGLVIAGIVVSTRKGARRVAPQPPARVNGVVAKRPHLLGVRRHRRDETPPVAGTEIIKAKDLE